MSDVTFGVGSFLSNSLTSVHLLAGRFPNMGQEIVFFLHFPIKSYLKWLFRLSKTNTSSFYAISCWQVCVSVPPLQLSTNNLPTIQVLFPYMPGYHALTLNFHMFTSPACMSVFQFGLCQASLVLHPLYSGLTWLDFSIQELNVYYPGMALMYLLGE